MHIVLINILPSRICKNIQHQIVSSYTTKSVVNSPNALPWDKSSCHRGPSFIYKTTIRKKKLQYNPEQEIVIKKLQNLYEKIIERDESTECTEYDDHTEYTQDNSSIYTTIISHVRTQFSKDTKSKNNDNNILYGQYLYGGVGCGKTMMMDMFYNSLRQYKPKQRREHFHHFMIDIHTRLHILRNQGVESTSKPLYDVARQYINDNGKILCLDEFQVTDVADAMILKELFEILFSFGCILITTSNRLPNDLYKNGINRELFIPFIDVLCKYCNIITLTKIPDFRQLVTMKNSAYYYPINDNTISSIDKAFTNLSAGAESNTLETTIQVYMGRDLYIQRGVVGFVAQFTFNELCISNLSSLDYISIAEHFPTIIITGIPVINPELRDVVRRFITLIDILYDNRIHVIFTSNVSPNDLFPPVDPNAPFDEAFAISRAHSRIIEMTSLEYLQRNQKNIS